MPIRMLLLALLAPLCGCAFMPEVSRQPAVHNPFPQLSRVAVAPFFNLSTEGSVDGRQFALAYFNELQSVPGFEVVPVGVSEAAMKAYDLRLENPADVRRLAQILGVDAVAVGAITDFTPYYPPRCGLRVEWYAANDCFHPIPAGYGLPWGTPLEKSLPQPLVYEAELAIARSELDAAAPAPTPWEALPPPEALPEQEGVQLLGGAAATTAAISASRAYCAAGAGGPCLPSDEAVLRHTRTYNGHDPHVAEALENYVYFRHDARFGGWQNYLQRSDDFIRFCCHLHISEMLTARGGAGESRVVWRWPENR